MKKMMAKIEKFITETERLSGERKSYLVEGVLDATLAKEELSRPELDLLAELGIKFDECGNLFIDKETSVFLAMLNIFFILELQNIKTDKDLFAYLFINNERDGVVIKAENNNMSKIVEFLGEDKIVQDINMYLIKNNITINYYSILRAIEESKDISDLIRYILVYYKEEKIEEFKKNIKWVYDQELKKIVIQGKKELELPVYEDKKLKNIKLMAKIKNPEDPQSIEFSLQ